MEDNQAKVLYLNKMSTENSGITSDSVHIMFDDGSMVRIQAEVNAAGEQDLQKVDRVAQAAASHLYQKILALVEQYPHSTEEVNPACLGDPTCMYCGGKGCVNCQR